ncbi:MAG: hypothetical protein ACLRY8_13510, partial [Clostridium butyricum]
ISYLVRRIKYMTVKELTTKTINDIQKRRSKKENEYNAYVNERYCKKIRNWSVRVGGCRW